VGEELSRESGLEIDNLNFSPDKHFSSRRYKFVSTGDDSLTSSSPSGLLEKKT
jgi:hypothetical protein